MSPANSLHVSALYSEFHERFDLIKKCFSTVSPKNNTRTGHILCVYIYIFFFGAKGNGGVSRKYENFTFLLLLLSFFLKRAWVICER